MIFDVFLCSDEREGLTKLVLIPMIFSLADFLLCCFASLQICYFLSGAMAGSQLHCAYMYFVHDIYGYLFLITFFFMLGFFVILLFSSRVNPPTI